jgi:hypothetical protein
MELLEKLKRMALSNETHIKITLGSIISLFVFIVGVTWVAAVKFSDYENRINKNTELVIYHQSEIDGNTTTNHLQEVKQAEIMIQLANIKDRQIEMIQILKEMD